MDYRNSCLMALTLLALTACDLKTKKTTPDVPKINVDEILENAKKDAGAQVINTILYKGGQPGKITVGGVIVKQAADKNLELDHRISVEQSTGKAIRGASETLVLDKNKTELITDVADRTMSITSKTYLNFGCQDLTAEETEGLKEKSGIVLDEVLALSAHKVFICGEFASDNQVIAIAGNEVVLRDAHITVQASAGNLTLLANKLVLEGQNTLEALGVDAASMVADGSSLDLIVHHKIHGEGTLTVKSIGGNCVENLDQK